MVCSDITDWNPCPSFKLGNTRLFGEVCLITPCKLALKDNKLEGNTQVCKEVPMALVLNIKLRFMSFSRFCS